MKNVAGPRKFAPNPSEEMWMLAFPVGSKRKNQFARRQKNYCYVCVAKERLILAIYDRARRSWSISGKAHRAFSRRALINLTGLEINAQICLE